MLEISFASLALIVIASVLAGCLFALILSRRRDAQQIVFASVRDRGYVSPWSSREFIQRQVIKLYEELGELANCVPTGSADLDYHAHMAYIESRSLFRTNTTDPDVYMNLKKAAEEIVDLQVVLYCIASMLNINLAKSATLKAQSDVARGVSKPEAT